MDTTHFEENIPLSAQLTEHALGYWYSAALRVAARIGVADHMADGPRSSQELADLTGVSSSHLQRLLRLLSSRGVFREEEGFFQLTPAAKPLLSDSPKSMRKVINMLTDETFWKSAEELEYSVRTGGDAFGKIFGSAFFEYLARTPNAGDIFDSGQAALSEIEDSAIVAAYQFPLTGMVVDVGGGRGGLLRHVLTESQGLSGILYERESVLRYHDLKEYPQIAKRWKVERGDFFEAIPAGADIYLLKRILHDWNDEQSLRILSACRAAMRKGSRLLVIDGIITPDNMPDLAKTLDMLMMGVFHGQERTLLDFRRLFADAGLKIIRLLSTTTALWIIEAVAI
ncbi:methyltransferase [Streptomyces syringium]|uniref:methyltransferase n=1 Tax=Streptomyces syringium TaxID=76729 RepID=UPI003423EB3B